MSRSSRLSRTVVSELTFADNPYFINVFNEVADLDKIFSDMVYHIRQDARWVNLFYDVCDCINVHLRSVPNEAMDTEELYNATFHFLSLYYDGRDKNGDLARVIDTIDDFYQEMDVDLYECNGLLDSETTYPKQTALYIGEQIFLGWELLLAELTHIHGHIEGITYADRTKTFSIFHT